jgi:hypothetical protein
MSQIVNFFFVNFADFYHAYCFTNVETGLYLESVAITAAKPHDRMLPTKSELTISSIDNHITATTD